MEKSPAAIAPLLLRNLLTSIFIHAYNSLLHISRKHRLILILRRFLVSAFLFFISLLPYVFSCLSPYDNDNYPCFKSSTRDVDGRNSPCRRGVGDSGVARALSQLLMIMNDIPVSSRKYEVVRSLTEKLIDENISESNLNDNQALRDVNCSVLSSAFARSLSQLEAAMVDDQSGAAEEEAVACNRPRWLLRAAWRYAKLGSELMRRPGGSAEKLAAEMLWLAQKMAASGCAEEAVCAWASACKLASLALSAEPRLQGSLVKVSALLIKQAKELGKEDGDTFSPSEEQQHLRQTKMKILISWLPLLCLANNGIDAPILNMGERAELERVLEEIISSLDEEEEQERVLSLWLHHFTYCPSSDWPNLRSSYTRWFSDSRARLLQSTTTAAAN